MKLVPIIQEGKERNNFKTGQARLKSPDIGNRMGKQGEEGKVARVRRGRGQMRTDGLREDDRVNMVKAVCQKQESSGQMA